MVFDNQVLENLYDEDDSESGSGWI